MKYLMALDQGTTSSRAVLYDAAMREIAFVQKPVQQFYPKPGWVEHDAEAIWQSQLACCREVLAKTKINVRNLAAIGIANQRETTVLWDRHSGKPVHRAIVWQDRRTAGICEALRERGLEYYVRMHTGLLIDSYFSGTKIRWLLDHVPGARENAESGNLLFGTMDTWLLWNLTGGRVHATDVSNASRTLIFNIRDRTWDSPLLSALNIPRNILPEVKNTSGFFGTTDLFGTAVPVFAMAGDQQAALFGQCCFEKGSAKNTYGTGCFLLMHIGNEFVPSRSKLITTIAWGLQGKISYALEGSIFIAGAVVQWLRDNMQLIQDVSETEIAASSLKDNGGVYFVPAFTGLGAPYWDMDARGIICGMSRGKGREHIIRAALESIAYQTMDVFEAMKKDTGIALRELRADGGATANRWLMQFQSDLLRTKVLRAEYHESSARGAAMLAGIGAELFTMASLKNNNPEGEVFAPRMTAQEAQAFYAGWKRAVQRARKK